MANSLKPASTFIPSRSPIVDKDGMATWSFIKILQDWDTKISNGLGPTGGITAPIPDDTPVEGRSEGIGTTLQYLDSNGIVLADGINFSRSYVNKDTDHITDGTGSPLAGGRAAYTALVGSSPTAGKTIRFDGVNWQTVPIAITRGAVVNQWINSYNATTGSFTSSQPAFSNISGAATAAQVPALSALTGRITTGQLPSAGISVTIVTAKLTGGGSNGSMTFTNGILTAQVQAT